MSIPANIKTELTALQSQVAAASPLAAADHATITAIKLNAIGLLGDVQAALVAPTNLDGWVAPTDPGAIVAGVNAIAASANDQQALSLMRGVVGRAVSNLDQIPS